MYTQIQPFLPTKNFDTSKSFYIELGFEVIYEDAQLCLFKKDQISFFIQRAYVKDWAENMVIQSYVDHIEDVFSKVMLLKSKYPMIKIKPPYQAPYGYTFHVLDPGGVLWHFTDPTIKQR